PSHADLLGRLFSPPPADPGAACARPQPVAHLLDFLPDELLIVKGICQRGDALAAGEKMHRQRVGVRPTAEQRELPAQPGAEQREQLVRLRSRAMIELRKLGAQRSDRATVTLYVRPVCDQNMDEASDAICRMLRFGFHCSSIFRVPARRTSITAS